MAVSKQTRALGEEQQVLLSFELSLIIGKSLLEGLDDDR